MHPLTNGVLQRCDSFSMVNMMEENKIAKIIGECSIGKFADLHLIIIGLISSRETLVCSECLSISCKSYCRKEHYVKKLMHFYDASDLNGNRINIRSAPWSKINLAGLESGKAYRIQGQIKGKFNEKFDLIQDEIEKVN